MNNQGNSIAWSGAAGEEMIMRMGWGPCHYFIIGLCAMCTMAEATASLIILVAMTLLACDQRYNKRDIMTLNAASSLGMALGSLLFGTLADCNGRKSLIPASMIVIFCATIGLSFAQTYFVISLSIFVLGIGAAGNNATLRLYLIECLPAKKRGTCLAVMDLIWFIGYMIAFGISLLLIPSAIRMLDNDFRPSSWRVIAGLAGAPNLIMACAAGLLPPSPRYLIYRRRPEQALIVLQHMFAVNNSQHVANFSPINLHDCHHYDDDDDDGDDDNDEISNGSLFDVFMLSISRIWRRIMFVFSFEFIVNTLLFAVIRLFLFPGFIWVAVWKTLVFTDHQTTVTHVNPTLIVDQASNCTDVVDMAINLLYNCYQIKDNEITYLFMFLSSFIIGETLLATGIDIIGRRLSLIMSGIIGATSIFAMTLTKYHYAKIVLSLLFLTSYSMLHTTTNIVQLETYPTGVRGTIIGLTSVLPHLASFIVILFAQITCVKSLHIAFSLLIGVTIAAISVLDFTNAPMREY